MGVNIIKKGIRSFSIQASEDLQFNKTTEIGHKMEYCGTCTERENGRYNVAAAAVVITTVD